ncbi:MAG: HAL/PAL/TAL family ammonia-lyase [candidate division WOR-3 bacterium]
MEIILDGNSLSLQDVLTIARGGVMVSLSPEARKRMLESRQVLEARAKKGPVYGFNTGLGKLAGVSLKPDDLRRFQLNTVRSHAVGFGEPISPHETRAVMLLRANTLAKGHSGVRPEVLDFLLKMLNDGILPVIPSMGSVGASGDLAPLAHMALAMVGEGQVLLPGGRILPSLIAFRERGIQPLVLEAREALALINGTQFTAGVLAILLDDAIRLSGAADLVGALSFCAMGSRPEQFHPDIMRLRPHQGQIASGANLRELIGDVRPGDDVQDPYSLRCMPQVHGSARDGIDFAKSILSVEINSATDNPLVIGNEVYSCGNFHGQHLGLAGDILSICLATLASVSERRTFLLLSGKGDLPLFLAENPGLQSGLMLLQTTQASLVSLCKSLSYPASVGSIPTSGGQEDFVPMSANAVLKAKEIACNAWIVLAGELVAATEALRLSGRKPSGGLGELYERYLEDVKPGAGDRFLVPEMERAMEFLRKF